MKKIAILTALFTGIFAASYAQQTNISTSPVYDNDKNEHLIKHVMTPKEMEKYALIDNNVATDNFTPVHRLTFNSTEITGNSRFEIDAYQIPPGTSPYDIKKVTFPKTNYPIHQ